MDTQTWSTVGSLPEQYQTSDHGSFTTGGNDDYIYIVGGYDANYSSLDTMYRIDTTAANLTTSIQERANLDQPRGDVTAVFNGKAAFISGGFTHTNNFCQPLASVETYNPSSDDWLYIAPLEIPRAEKVLVAVFEDIYAVGGETHVDDYCDTNVTHDVGEQTVAVDNVEVYDGNEWKVLWSLANHKFRFAAVSVNSTIYTFGGQSSFAEGCQCYPTTKEVVAYVEGSGDDASSAMNVYGGGIVGVIGMAFAMVCM